MISKYGKRNAVITLMRLWGATFSRKENLTRLCAACFPNCNSVLCYAVYFPGLLGMAGEMRRHCSLTKHKCFLSITVATPFDSWVIWGAVNMHMKQNMKLYLEGGLCFFSLQSPWFLISLLGRAKKKCLFFYVRNKLHLVFNWLSNLADKTLHLQKLRLNCILGPCFKRL